MLIVYLPVISLVVLPVFVVVLLLGVFKKNRKLRIMGSLGCLAAMLCFSLTAAKPITSSDSLNNESTTNHEQDWQKFLDETNQSGKPEY